MELVYKVKDRPPFGKLIVAALQQLLAILAATIAVPAAIGHGMSASAALFGAGAGTLVPITGFANSVVSPALEFKSEGYVTGTGAKMFVIAGPVIVYGTTASVLYGIIYCLVR